MRSASVAGVLLAFALAGCTAMSGQGVTSSHSELPAKNTEPPGAADCKPPSPAEHVSEIGFDAYVGTPAYEGASAYALMFNPLPLRVGKAETKMVIRTTGSGDLTVRMTRPSGDLVQPAWGPEPHGTSSNFDRPGEEWGIGFVFGEAGCWSLEVLRGNDREATFWIPVN